MNKDPINKLYKVLRLIYMFQNNLHVFGYLYTNVRTYHLDLLRCRSLRTRLPPLDAMDCEGSENP